MARLAVGGGSCCLEAEPWAQASLPLLPGVSGQAACILGRSPQEDT